MFVLTPQEGKPNKVMKSAEFSAFLSALQLVESAQQILLLNVMEKSRVSRL
jgi:hypothetical protein